MSDCSWTVVGAAACAGDATAIAPNRGGGNEGEHGQAAGERRAHLTAFRSAAPGLSARFAISDRRQFGPAEGALRCLAVTFELRDGYGSSARLRCGCAAPVAVAWRRSGNKRCDVVRVPVVAVAAADELAARGRSAAAARHAGRAAYGPCR